MFVKGELMKTKYTEEDNDLTGEKIHELIHEKLNTVISTPSNNE